MTTLGYSSTGLIGDYIRAGAGFGGALVALAIADTPPAVTAVLAGCAGLFAAFAAATVAAHATRVEVDEQGVRTRGIRPRSLHWRELDRFRLAFYATRRDRSDGWMRLTLAARGQRIAVESRLDGFDALAARAAEAAWFNGIAIDPASAANLTALGITPPGAAGPRGWR